MKKNIKENRHKLVDIYKISKGCEICGYNKHPSALCFDHIEEFEKSEHVKNGYSKRNSAGGMYRLYTKKIPVEYLIAEIKKCKILCSNCHMEKTHCRNKRTTNLETEKIFSIEELENKIKNYEDSTDK